MSEKRLLLIEGAAARAEYLMFLSRMLETELGDRPRALDAAARALAERPSDVTLADEVERLGVAAGLPEEAAAAMERVLEGAVTPSYMADMR